MVEQGIDHVVLKITAEEYLEKYAHDFYEWVNGVLIKMSPATIEHSELIWYLNTLLKAYFGFNPIGRVIAAPYVMEIEATNSKREPDLQVIFNTNPGELTQTRMVGPADICIEVVSSESIERDYGTKSLEYEQGGVREYWILDPERQASLFYRLNLEGRYIAHSPDADGNYRTPLLPGFVLHVPTLWQKELPSPNQIVEAVKAMLQSAGES